MKNNGSTFAGALTAAVIAVFFVGIALFLMFGVLKIQNYDAAVPCAVFCGINLLLIVLLYGGSSYLLKKILLPSFISICAVTTFYTILQFAYMLCFAKSVSVIGYILSNLCLLFLYFVIVLPTIAIGSKAQN